MKNQRGLTTIDILLILLIVVAALTCLSLIPDVFGAYHRNNCYLNQMNLDKILWGVCNQQEREVYDVQIAYSIRYPDSRPPLMVVLFNPNLKDANPQRKIVTVDLSTQSWTTDALCPLHKNNRVQPVIDYWFALGRWHCLYNRYHSE